MLVYCHVVDQSCCDRLACRTCCEGAVADGHCSHMQGVLGEIKDLSVLERFAFSIMREFFLQVRGGAGVLQIGGVLAGGSHPRKLG